MSQFKRIKAAIIGCGTISQSYLAHITESFHVIEMVGCSDLIPERSAKRAEEYSIRQMTNEEILNDPEIQIVINTTYPTSHYEVTKAALLAGKHVYSEKMLAVELEDGKELVELAKSKGLWFTAAPDTFLGGGWQTARHLIDSGVIGKPITAYGLCVRSYQDHGDTASEIKPFIFCAGGGIPFDMGGYYLHNMINLFGSINKVSGFIKTHNQTRAFTNPRHPNFGENFTIDSPNTMIGSLEFKSDVIASLTITSEAALGAVPRFEVHGTQGNLILFDPNDFGGVITLQKNTSQSQTEIQSLFPFTDDSRGIGVAEMAYALLDSRKPRASAELGYHAFEAIHGIWKSSINDVTYKMQSECERPCPLPLKALSGTAYESILA